MADPKLVEALDRLDYLHELAATTCEDEADGELVDNAASVVRVALVSRVQLPEVPFRWAVLGYLDGPFVVDSETGADRILRVTPGASKAPVYIIPGDPQEVDDGREA